jgi:dTDP-D-glucose 4,6-dehydratase
MVDIDEGLKGTIDWYENNKNYLENIKFKYSYEN